jgi:hypothetical protein
MSLDIKPQVEALLLSRLGDRSFMREVLKDKKLEELLNESVQVISTVFESTAKHFIHLVRLKQTHREIPVMGPPCDGGCGGVSEFKVDDNKNYCVGCLLGAYHLNTNALKEAKRKLEDVDTEYLKF